MEILKKVMSWIGDKFERMLIARNKLELIKMNKISDHLIAALESENLSEVKACKKELEALIISERKNLKYKITMIDRCDLHIAEQRVR